MRGPQDVIARAALRRPDAISNLLVEMGDAGSIERVWMGREKMVYLPGAKSDLVAPSETDEAPPR